MLFRSNDTATTEIYTQRDTLSLHDALPILDTGNFQRNISAQIDLFQAQQQHPAAAAAAHGGGVALVVVSGNDYSYAADKDNSTSVRQLSPP